MGEGYPLPPSPTFPLLAPYQTREASPGPSLLALVSFYAHLIRRESVYGGGDGGVTASKGENSGSITNETFSHTRLYPREREKE